MQHAGAALAVTVLADRRAGVAWDRMTAAAASFDLARYLARIGLDAPPPLTAAGLSRLQAAHRLAIGFENLDIPLGRGIAIDSAAVFDKLVARGRGGYCFEHNRLLRDALAALGFACRPLLARVYFGVGPGIVTPRTHICLAVEIDGALWLADAGFGGSNLPPLPIVDGATAQTSDGAGHRLRRIGEQGALRGQWLLERAGSHHATDGRAAPHGEWQAQYAFDMGAVAEDDLEQANHWTSTRPGTRFTTLCVASIPQPQGFASMVDRQLTVHGLEGTQQREIADAADYARTLRDVFRIALAEADAARLPLFG
ncbi:arylamine N-acetyltransferase [Novosphingobium colocasiae]|uniref:arylamine N-acetyltransferase family protein n=1 Tax=Novosphingobium colocasiae TaxID=1256513 RepID=UPI0035B318E0